MKLTKVYLVDWIGEVEESNIIHEIIISDNSLIEVIQNHSCMKLGESKPYTVMERRWWCLWLLSWPKTTYPKEAKFVEGTLTKVYLPDRSERCYFNEERAKE